MVKRYGVEFQWVIGTFGVFAEKTPRLMGAHGGVTSLAQVIPMLTDPKERRRSWYESAIDFIVGFRETDNSASVWMCVVTSEIVIDYVRL